MRFKDEADHKDSEIKQSFERMIGQINEKGGELNFVLKTDQDGWFSVCREFPAIVTGGSSTNPSQEEIARCTVEAVKTAFNVPITPITPLTRSASLLLPVKFSWERELSLA